MVSLGLGRLSSSSYYSECIPAGQIATGDVLSFLLSFLPLVHATCLFETRTPPPRSRNAERHGCRDPTKPEPPRGGSSTTPASRCPDANRLLSRTGQPMNGTLPSHCDRSHCRTSGSTGLGRWRRFEQACLAASVEAWAGAGASVAVFLSSGPESESGTSQTSPSWAGWGWTTGGSLAEPVATVGAGAVAGFLLRVGRVMVAMGGEDGRACGCFGGESEGEPSYLRGMQSIGSQGSSRMRKPHRAHQALGRDRRSRVDHRVSWSAWCRCCKHSSTCSRSSGKRRA
ncbi:hypothetical protein B0H63DRAFT_92028 [Podospora didyma]|uniref:Uncharacterized protein n=1 Tax=Podospora didyma TaxID=330526 RepID=A0AAE0JYU0_9PEZI|nr:hypothetical protein B0H63DRAFT_92028 [Podospora didyma]